MAEPLIRKRRSFGRVANLVALFGYGSVTPYNTPSINPGAGRLSLGNFSTLNGVQDWYQKQMTDAQDYVTAMMTYRDMVAYSPIAGAVRVIIEECIQAEQSAPGTLWAEGGDSEIESILSDLLVNRLHVEDVIRSQFWWIVAYGNNIEKLWIGPEGVHGWQRVDLKDVERIVDQTRRLVGFYWKVEDPPDRDCPVFGSGADAKKLWKPWDFLHMRLMGEDRDSEYGTSLLKPGVNTYRKLRMAEDQMVTYRLQLQPSRYVLKLDTGDSPVTDVGLIMNEWNNYLRGTRRIDPSKGEYEHRYQPWALDDIVILPIKKDSNTSFEKLDGDSDVPDVTDVEYLMRQLAGMLNIPPDFLGVRSEGDNGLSSKSALSVQDLRFQRSVKSVRVPVMRGYDLACRIHLALLGKDPFTPFRIRMSNITMLESDMQMELVAAQADLADKLIALGNNINAPKEEWLRLIFTKYMPLPDELVDIVAIGSATQTPGEVELEPLPPGPSFDNEIEPAGPLPGGAARAPVVGRPEEPPLENRIRTFKRRMMEHRIRVRNHYKRAFEPKNAVARYSKNLHESTRLTEAQLVEVRSKISTVLTEGRRQLKTNAALRFSIGRIIRIVEGYTPDFYTLNEKQILEVTNLVESRKSTPVVQKLFDPLQEFNTKMIKEAEEVRKFRVENTSHPLLEHIKIARKKKLES